MVKSPPMKQLQRHIELHTWQCPLPNITYSVHIGCLFKCIYDTQKRSFQWAQIIVHLFGEQIFVECPVWALHCARHRGHTIRTPVISPLYQNLCRNEKNIQKADSGTFLFFWAAYATRPPPQKKKTFSYFQQFTPCRWKSLSYQTEWFHSP